MKKAKMDRKEPLMVLGVPRGGVVVADVVASKLPYQCDFDIIVPRKLTAPGNQEIAIGAIMMAEDGNGNTTSVTYLNDYLIKELEVQQDHIEKEKARQVGEIKRRQSLYRSPKRGYNIQGRIVILVDDGAATGATLIAAARWVQNKSPKRLVIAVPVAPKDTVALLKRDCDLVVTGTTPSSASIFKSVGQYYREFRPVEDGEVMEICKRRGLQI
jgi:predicted phosphoribosyltransferase